MVKTSVPVMYGLLVAAAWVASATIATAYPGVDCTPSTSTHTLVRAVGARGDGCGRCPAPVHSVQPAALAGPRVPARLVHCRTLGIVMKSIIGGL